MNEREKYYGVGGVSNEDGATDITVTIYRDSPQVMGVITNPKKEGKGGVPLVATYSYCEKCEEWEWNAVGVIREDGKSREVIPREVPIPIEHGLFDGLEQAREFAHRDLLEKLEEGDG